MVREDKKPKVLFVDDDEMVLKSIKRATRNENFECFFAQSGIEALKILELDKFHVIVTDMRMPDMSGLDLLKRVFDKYPDVIRIILTGYAQVQNIISAIHTGHIFRYLTKPWKYEEEFLPAIEQGIEYHDLIVERRETLEMLKSQNIELKEKNSEIEGLRKMLEISEEQKTRLLKAITNEVLPFVDFIIEEEKKYNLPKNRIIIGAEKISELLHKVKQMLD